MGRVLLAMGMVLAGMAGGLIFWDTETLHGPFLLDDRGTVTMNPCVKPEIPGSWERLWTHDYWGQDALTSPKSHKSFRPITTTTLRWNYAYGGMNTYGYRVVNVALHAIVSMLAVICFALSQVKGSAIIAAAGGLAFALHPVHAEAVSNVTGRAEVLSALFYCAGFICYTSGHARRSNDTWEPRGIVWNVLAYLLTMSFTALAVFSKEHGITLPVMCVIWDAFIASSFSAHNVILGWRDTGAVRGRWWRWLRKTAIMAVSTLALGVFRLSLNGGTSAVFIAEQNPAAKAKFIMHRVLSYSWIYIRNLGNLVVPVQLCPDWTGGAIPNVTSFGDWRSWAVALLYISLLMWLCWICRRPNWKSSANGQSDNDNKDHKHAVQEVEILKRDQVMMMAWMVIPFVMSMNIVTVVGFVLADRVLYLSALGWCMFLAALPRTVCTLLQTPSHTATVQYLASATPGTPTDATPGTAIDEGVSAGMAKAASSGADEGKGAATSSAETAGCPTKQIRPGGGKRPMEEILKTVVVAVVAFYTHACYHQNRVWRNETSLWTHAYNVNPLGHIVQSEYGKSLANNQRYEEAIGVLTAALASSADSLTLMGSLGLSLAYTGRCEEAIKHFSTGLQGSLHPGQDPSGEAGTPQPSLAAIFYTGLSHCAPSVAAMHQLALKAVQTFPQSEFALEHAVKVKGIMEQLRANKVDPASVKLEVQIAPNGDKLHNLVSVDAKPPGMPHGMPAGRQRKPTGGTALKEHKPHNHPNPPLPNEREYDSAELRSLLFMLKHARIEF